MPIPLLLGIAAAVAAIGGVSVGVKGACDMTDAKKTLEKARKRDEKNKKRQQTVDKEACDSMDELGTLEMNILTSFKQFSDVIEKIKNRPSFAKVEIGDVSIPNVDTKELEQTSIGASILLGGLGGAALGAAGGFAASGATTAAVMAFGTASTGTAISTLSGVAATNATLAALGGGSLAAGGGGIALGTTILGVSTLGVGLLVGGVIFGLVGSHLSDKADEAYNQMLKNEKVINKICIFLNELTEAAQNYLFDLSNVNNIYIKQFGLMKNFVNSKTDADGKVDWRQLSEEQKITVNNVVMLVGLLYYMCKVKLVKKDTEDDKYNSVNYTDINDARDKYNKVMEVVCPK